MASRVVSRVFVASTVRDLTKLVQKQLASVKVEELRNTDTEPGDKAEALKEVEVLLCDGHALINLLKNDAVPNLKWAHFTWAGVERLMKALNHERPKQDFMLTRSAAFSDLMGEYVIGQIIARERDFNGMKDDQEKKEFRNEQFRNFRPLNTLTIGILGYGTIGKRVAEMCKFMGMTVWAVNRVKQTSPSPHVDHFRGMDSLPEVLQNVDYLCSILPSTPDTCDLLSGQVLSHCRHKKTVLINIGRGSVISDDSLIQAVREGWLGGAILDVFNQEPLPADSALWELPGVTITPHVSGPSLSLPVCESFVKNLKLYQAGQPLNNMVDWERGY